MGAQKLALDIEPFLNLQRMLGMGTAFPSSGSLPGGLQTNDRFFRTDLGWWCFYDGTRWLTVHEYVHPVGEISTAAPAAIRTVIRTDYALYFTWVVIRAFVTGTNNGSNYWNLVCQTTDVTIATQTTIYGPNTSAVGAGAWRSFEGLTTPSPGANNAWLRLNCTIGAGAPGSLVANAIAAYRLVVT